MGRMVLLTHAHQAPQVLIHRKTVPCAAYSRRARQCSRVIEKGQYMQRHVHRKPLQKIDLQAR